MKSPTNKVGRKVWMSGLSGAIVTILVFGTPAFTGYELPADVAVAIVTLLMAGVAYQTAPAARDVYSNETKTEAVPVLKRDVIE